jgi:hypothetical protein
MAKISPKKESDKPRNPFTASFEKINEGLAPAINGIKSLDFSRFTEALGPLDSSKYAEEQPPEIEALAGRVEIQINPDLYKYISRPDPDPYPPHLIQHLLDLQAKLDGYENEDSPTATTQPVEDIPKTFEEFLQGITLDELTKRLQSIGYVNDANVWIGRGNQIPVLWDIMRKKALVKTSTPVLAFGQAVREHYKGGRGTSDGTLKAQPDYISFTQKQAKQAFLDIL